MEDLNWQIHYDMNLTSLDYITMQENLN